MTRKGSILRSRGNQSALPDLERMLTIAAATQVKESNAAAGRRIAGWRASRVVAVGVACLAFGGTAMAATGVWDPGIGARSSSGPASISTTPVPAALVAQIAVLRRDQTDQDRSPEVEATLARASLAGGVRPDSARFLAPGANGEATVMFSAEKGSSFVSEGEPVCVDRPFAPFHQSGYLDNGAFCFGLGELLSGHAYATDAEVASNTWLTVGVVPDGVATVTAEFGSAPDVTVPVTNNYWELSPSGPQLSNANGEAGVEHTVWRDADGNVVPQAAQPTG
jgi:hypothetical protein